MPDYLITWVDYALEQYLALSEHVATQLHQQLRQLGQQPKSNAHYDPDTDRWSVEFDAGQGLVLYIVNDERRRVVILRIVHLG